MYYFLLLDITTWFNSNVSVSFDFVGYMGAILGRGGSCVATEPDVHPRLQHVHSEVPFDLLLCR